GRRRHWPALWRARHGGSGRSRGVAWCVPIGKTVRNCSRAPVMLLRCPHLEPKKNAAVVGVSLMDWSPESGSLAFPTLKALYASNSLGPSDVVRAVYRRLDRFDHVWISKTP